MSKQFIVESVRITGFRSYTRPVVFKFNTTGLYHISGTNGAGKTTLFSALCWGIYGINLNDTNQDAIQTYDWLRPEDYLGTRVAVTARTAKNRYLIVRHLKYKGKTQGMTGGDSLMIFAMPLTEKRKFTPEDMLPDLGKDELQKKIHKLTGLTEKAFTNSIIFGQRMARLVTADAKAKRQLFEMLFELDWIDTAKDNADKERVRLEKVVTEKITAIGYLETLIDNLQSNFERSTQVLEQFVETKEANMLRIKGEHKGVKAELEELREQLEKAAKAKTKKTKGEPIDLEALSNAVDDWRDKLNLYKDALQRADRNIEKADEYIRERERDCIQLGQQWRDIKKTCTTCGSPLKPEQVKTAKDALQTKMDTKDSEIKRMQMTRGDHAATKMEYTTKVQEATAEYEKANKAYVAARQANKLEDTGGTDTGVIQGQITALSSRLVSIKQNYNRERNTEPPAIDLEKLETDLAVKESERETLIEEKTVAETELGRVNWWIKKAFSAAGMKSFIFSAMLEKLNEYALAYSPHFGFTVRFWVDLAKPSKPFCTTIYRGEREVDYDDLSGGEKQKVDVCLAFAMNDLINFKTHFNILVLDECFEGLAMENVQMVNDIIKEKAETKAVYLITHNPLHAANADYKYDISGGGGEEESTIS